MSPDRIKLLQDMAIFGGISERSLQFLLDRSNRIQVSADDYFFREDDTAESMFILDSGTVDILKSWNGQTRFLRSLAPGDCFGEVALMDMMPRSASVRATTAAVAIELPRSALYELMQSDLEQFTMIMMNMGREVSRRLRKSDTRLFEVQQDGHFYTE